MAEIDIVDVVQDLRTELGSAMAAAGTAAEGVRFDVGPIELTLSVQVTRSVTPGAKVKFWVIEAGTDLSAARASTQQIKVTLTPVDTSDPVAPPVSPGSVRITGTSVDGER